MSRPVYITSLGKFLPGDPVTNEEMEAHLGLIGGRPSRMKARILRQNGIRTRHYAIDREGHVLYWNCELAARAALDALTHSELSGGDVEYLAAATSQPDLLAPGFASMVHGELRLPPCEIASFHGVCAGGMAALKSSYMAVAAGEHANALVCASEFTSRFFRPGLFEETQAFREKGRVAFDSEFLRWMLSDGAGAATLEARPNERGLSLRIEWVDLVSYADRFDVCMYAGANKLGDRRLDRSWYDYANFAEAARDGAMLLKQDLELLEQMVPLGVGRYFELVEAGRFRPAEVDWMVCHYSSHVFRGKIFELLEKGGGMIPEERWFTNLYTKGNTGSASLFIMLEELFNDGRLEPGQKILCMVPESGRFVVSYMLLTVAGARPLRAGVRPDAPSEGGPASPRTTEGAGEPPDILEVTGGGEVSRGEDEGTSAEGDQLRARLMRQLAQVWADFEGRLARVPVVDKINRGKLRMEDYRLLLLNLRQQVAEGARWISRAASNVTLDAFELRSMFIAHAADEHRDFQLIERDYVSVGGRPEEIEGAEKNIGSEALSAWMFHRASQENPFDLFGAMFIIEGLGRRMARRWAQKIREQLGLGAEQVSFLLYHGGADEGHFERLESALMSGILSEELVRRIVKTAKVTARLYALQLEELGNT